MHGLPDRLEEINTKIVKLSKEIAGGRAYVAGDMTTTGRMLEPAGDISYEELLDVYKEQAAVLANAGADLIIAETMLSVDETTVLLDAVQAVCDLPVMCSLTLEADGRALYGGDAVEAVETLQAMGAVSVGLNCSVGPNQLEAVICSMKEVAEIPVLAKPNAGMPVMDKMGFAHYDMTPEQFAAAMKKLIEAGAGVVGGCCGTTPEYIRALAKVIGGNEKNADGNVSFYSICVFLYKTAGRKRKSFGASKNSSVFCPRMCLKDWMLPYFEFTLILHIPRFTFYIAPLQYCS
ncbi:MAG: homocysteine S-methyltransferase family protein [Lachnospiraceae bacterium]